MLLAILSILLFIVFVPLRLLRLCVSALIFSFWRPYRGVYHILSEPRFPLIASPGAIHVIPYRGRQLLTIQLFSLCHTG